MTVREPKKRSNLRLKLGGAYFSAQRKLRWLSMRKHFARERSGEDLAYQAFSHHTPLWDEWNPCQIYVMSLK